MSSYRQKIGKKGEKIAADFLEKQGIKVIEFNYYTRYGEVDLIARDRGEIVFVEVKTRKSKKYGKPQEAITKTKQTNLIRTAQVYLQKNNLEESDWRIDVVAINLKKGQVLFIEQIKNAVTYF